MDAFNQPLVIGHDQDAHLDAVVSLGFETRQRGERVSDSPEMAKKLEFHAVLFADSCGNGKQNHQSRRFSYP
jgi:hypothetical protein